MSGTTKILTADKRGCRKGPDAWFTGTVWINEIVIGVAPSRLVGQTLQVVEGLGLVQLAGKAAQIIRPGDTVLIAPQERHWHGAAPGRTMTHLAMQETDAQGIDVVWLEHVTDEEYSAT
jgi:hypothetical protein